MALSDEDVEFLGDWFKASEEAVEDLDRKLMTLVNDLSSLLTIVRTMLVLFGASIFIVGVSMTGLFD